MLQNVYFLAKIGVDTAENEQHFAEILPIGRRVRDPGGAPRGLPGRLGPRGARAGASPVRASGLSREIEKRKGKESKSNHIQITSRENSTAAYRREKEFRRSLKSKKKFWRNEGKKGKRAARYRV